MQTISEASIIEKAHERLAWSFKDASKATGLSVGLLRDKANKDLLKTRYIGRRRLILDLDLRAFLENLQTEK